jgi:hypothetical protein
MGRLLLCHCMQPLSYGFTLLVYYRQLDYSMQILGRCPECACCLRPRAQRTRSVPTGVCLTGVSHGVFGWRARHLPATVSGFDIHGASIRWPFVCSIVAIREAMYLCALLSCLRYNRALLLVDVTASVHDNGGGGWKWLVLYAIAPVRRPLRHNDSSVRLITRQTKTRACVLCAPSSLPVQEKIVVGALLLEGERPVQMTAHRFHVPDGDECRVGGAAAEMVGSSAYGVLLRVSIHRDATAKAALAVVCNRWSLEVVDTRAHIDRQCFGLAGWRWTSAPWARCYMARRFR